MYSRVQLAKKYIRHYLTASSGKGHGIHSPFIFDFIIHVLHDNRQFYAYQSIENLRYQLLNDKTVLEIEDFGAGSRIGINTHLTIAWIAKNAAMGKKLSQLLFRMVHYYQPKLILELGTSLGISSAYMAAANPSARLITMEGAIPIAKRAAHHHQMLALHNSELIIGNFEDTLEAVLQPLNSVDLAFIDGNHRLEPTKKYFEQLLSKATGSSIFIFDDIHWSIGMETAWDYIKNHPAVTATIDLFFIGIVLFRPEFKSKQQCSIRF